MSLITRCPACGTMFKVVADQLKIAQGWVRCGQCSEVFDASSQLLPAEATELGFTASATDEMSALEPTFPPPQGARDPEIQPNPIPESTAELSTSLADGEHLSSKRPEFDEAKQDDGSDFDPAGWKRALRQLQQQELDASRLNVPPAEAPPGRQELARTATADDDSGFEPSNLPEPKAPDSVAENSEEVDVEGLQNLSFVRDARRKAFWKRPPVRVSLAVLSLLLLSALVLQWVMQQKDSLAALEPRLVPVLQALCGPLRCEVKPPRHIESLVIDSSSFNRIGPDTYRLSFALKNTGITALEMPSLELTLTDTQDQALVRRVLAPGQFGATTATLASHSEWAGAVNLKVSADGGRAGLPLPSSAPAIPLRVAGYRILAFYP
ncbi:MAG: DUF3426 domain-containing protein [Polaromonas sp.]